MLQGTTVESDKQTGDRVCELNIGFGERRVRPPMTVQMALLGSGQSGEGAGKRNAGRFGDGTACMGWQQKEAAGLPNSELLQAHVPVPTWLEHPGFQHSGRRRFAVSVTAIVGSLSTKCNLDYDNMVPMVVIIL